MFATTGVRSEIGTISPGINLKFKLKHGLAVVKLNKEIYFQIWAGAGSSGQNGGRPRNGGCRTCGRRQERSGG